MPQSTPKWPEPYATGRCMCGKVSYTVASAPMATGLCHCNHCQPQAGTAFSVVMIIPRIDVVLHGEVAIYNDVGSSGLQVLRRYCPSCGSPLTTESDAAPDGLFLKSGTLDDNSMIKPQFEMFVGRRQAWLQPFPGLVQYPGNPDFLLQG